MVSILRRVLAVLFVGICLCSQGAELKVRSFEYDPMDLTARRYQRRDLNNNGCAVIVVHLPIRECEFQGNVIGEPEFHANEYWVWVTPGTKMLKVLCPGVESLMVNFTDGQGKPGVESLATYHLRLDGYESSLGTQPVYTGPQKGYVVIEITPAVPAMVEIGGKMRTATDGAFKSLMEYGTYPFTVLAEGYARYSGTITVNSDEGAKMKVALVSEKSPLKVNSVTEGVTLSIDGKIVGKAPYTSEMLAGTYSIEATKAGYRPYRTSVEVAESTPVEVTIPALTPMYGALNIDYEPMGATISVDGEVKGVTPKILSQVLEGTHSVTISLDGYEPVTHTVSIAMGETTTLAGKLEEVNEVKLTLKKQDGKYGFVDKSGNVVIPCIYDDADSFSEGLAWVKQNGKTGYIDKSGNVVIPFIYDKGSSFHEGLARVYENGKYGFIDNSGNLVIPFKYDFAGRFSEGLAYVMQNYKLGYLDNSGNVVIPFKYDNAGPFSEGLAKVKQDGKWGYIDKSGNVVIPFKYDDAYLFSEGLALVGQNGKYGYLDKSGNAVIPFKYVWADSFSEGLAKVKQNGKFGFVDKSGNEVIPFKYDWSRSFSEGLAAVEQNGKWGFVDNSGNAVIPFIFDTTHNFLDGFAGVTYNGKYRTIDKEGNFVD